MSFKKWLMLCSLLMLTACSTLQPPPAPSNQAISWDARVQTLSNIEEWDLKALVGIRSSAFNGSANLHWAQQRQRHYTLSLFGPLGMNAVTLTGQPGNVVLKTSDGKVIRANSAETLLARQLGWKLPVSNLYYWVRGLPAPRISAQKQFDAYHHLTELTQDGWHIQFTHYTSINTVDLPNKIFIEYPSLNIKLIIEQWKL